MASPIHLQCNTFVGMLYSYHAVASLSSPVNQQHIDVSSDEEAPLSYLCKCNAPSNRKESRLPIMEAVFQKHVYGRQKKQSL